jgi:hypothetical protein
MFHPAGLKQPFTNIDLACKFQGHKFMIDLSKLARGGEHGEARASGSGGHRSPTFDLTLDMDSSTPPISGGRPSGPSLSR